MKTASDLSATGDRPFADDEVAAKFAAYPASACQRLLEVRRLIFDVAARTEGVGPIEEALRWGQPSYLTSSSGSGSTIRIDANGADGFAIYFICHTNLIATFRSLYPDELTFEGDRALLFSSADNIPEPELGHCLALALTYHRRKGGAKAPAPKRQSAHDGNPA